MSDPNARRAALERVQQKAASALRVKAEVVRQELYGLLEEHRNGSGSVYPGNKNPSSKPGDPPARQTGRLMESIKVMPTASPLVFHIGPDPAAFRGLEDGYYPAKLEFGDARVAPRPFMRPGAARARRKLAGGS